MEQKTRRRKEERISVLLPDPLFTHTLVLFLPPPVNEKSIILVNYLCLHAIQVTSEMFLHKEETVYKTLSQV